MKTTTISSFLMLSFLLVLAPFISAQNVKADDAKGLWLSGDEDARVEIYAQGGKYYGKIVWLKEPIDPDTGKPKVDKDNPDPKLRGVPTMGLVILKDFRFENGEWSSGTIYDPKSGKTYKSFIKMPNRNTLDMRGYIGASWMGLGRTTRWTRVSP